MNKPPSSNPNPTLKVPNPNTTNIKPSRSLLFVINHSLTHSLTHSPTNAKQSTTYLPNLA